MKKILFSVVCLMMVGIQSVKAQTPAAIMLMHQGNATMYSNQELTTAVSAAEAGDTIFLSNGTYNVTSGLTIDKPVSIIGAGQGTVVSGDININININTTNTITGRMLDALNCTGSIAISDSPDGIIIRKCFVQKTLSLGAGTGNVFVDRCYFRYFYSENGGFSKSFDAQNSVFSELQGNSSDGYSGNITFTNCNIASFKGNTIFRANGTFVNCIVDNGINNYGVYNNCLVFSTSSEYGSSFNNCWTGFSTSNFSTDSSGFPTISGISLEERHYYGTDGKIIGAEGGSTPYTLTPSLPTVSESSFTVDDSNRTLNVTLKVTAE